MLNFTCFFFLHTIQRIFSIDNIIIIYSREACFHHLVHPLPENKEKGTGSAAS